MRKRKAEKNREVEKRVKVGFTLQRKQATLLRVLAKVLGVTQGEVMGFLLDMAKKDIRNVLPKLKEMAGKERAELEKTLGEI